MDSVALGGRTDLVSLKEILTRAGKIEEIGGPAYLASLTDGVPRSWNVPHYIDLLKDLRLRREVLALSSELTLDVGHGEKNGKDLLQALDARVLGLMRERTEGPISMERAMPAFVEALDARIARKHELIGISTGFRELDDLTMGMQPGDVTVLAAITGCGKTSLALNIAETMSSAGPGLVFSLEMSREQLLNRLVSAKAGVLLFRLLRGYLSEEEMQRVGQAWADLAAKPLYVDDTATLTISEIRSRCRRMVAEHGLKFVVIDYLQLITGERGRGTSRTEEVAAISRGIKLLAKELRVPIIVLSQLSRKVVEEKRRPQLNDLRESGAIEQDADIVLFIHRQELYTSNVDQRLGLAELIIGKQRQGPTATIDLEFDGSCVRFKEWDAAKPKPEPQARKRGKVEKAVEPPASLPLEPVPPPEFDGQNDFEDEDLF